MSRRGDEADDLLQVVLLAAVEAGRADLSSEANLHWIRGAIRRQAAFQARTVIRRRRREDRAAVHGELTREASSTDRALPRAFLAGLSPALRVTALLALTGHDRREIAWLLAVSPAALRQRIAELRRRWHRYDGGAFREFSGLRGTLDYGRIRASLRATHQHVSAGGLGSHDPDGHLLILSSHFRGRRQPVSTTN